MNNFETSSIIFCEIFYITCKAFCRCITNFRSMFPMYFFGGKSKFIFGDNLNNMFWSLTKSLYRLNIFQVQSWTPVRVTSMTYSYNRKHTKSVKIILIIGSRILSRLLLLCTVYPLVFRELRIVHFKGCVSSTLSFKVALFSNIDIVAIIQH